MAVVKFENTQSSGAGFVEVHQQQAWNAMQKQITDELLMACKGKEGKIMQLLGPQGMAALKKCKGLGDLKSNLMELLEVVLAQLDVQIYERINELHAMSKKMKKVSQKQAEKNPGLTSGLNVDSSVAQQILTMLVQRRQQVTELVSNACKTIDDANRNTIRNMLS